MALFDWLRSRNEAAPTSGPLALWQAGRHGEARAACESRLAANPADAQALYVQGLLLLDSGLARDAAAVLQRAATLSPDDPDAAAAYGRALAESGRLAQASAVLEVVHKSKPSHSGVSTELAILALGQGRHEEAARHLSPHRPAGARQAQAFYLLATAERQRGRLDDAVQALRRAIAADPGHAAAHADLGAALNDLGQREEGGALLERALALDADLPSAAFNLAMLRIGQGRWAPAHALLQRYTAAQPRDADGFYWLGNAAMGLGDASGACEAYRSAIRLDSHSAPARWGLAMAQLPPVPQTQAEERDSVVRFEEELARAGQWLTKYPSEGVRAVGAQQPFYLAYVEQDHRQTLQRYGALCAQHMAHGARKARLPRVAPVPGRARLRVGIVSAHVQAHSVWHALVRGWVAHLPPERFELQLFHTGSVRDEQTRWAQSRVQRLHQGLGDWNAWAQAIGQAQCDVLIYPEVGMDATTVRLAALRLAPVQLAAWGHPITTGMPTMEGFLSAQAFEPAGAPAHYTEKLLALPRLGCAYAPYGVRPQPPRLGSLGLDKADRLLLCPGMAFKYRPQDDATLVSIASRCQPCKLVFFETPGDGVAARLQARLREAFASSGLDFDAVVRFLPWQSQAGFFGLLQRAHVVLDTLGFSGFNTTMQAIECAAPVVAFEGAFMRGRFASGILRSLELHEWVADTRQGYIDRVARLCEDADARRALQQALVSRRDRLYGDRQAVAALAGAIEQFVTR